MVRTRRHHRRRPGSSTRRSYRRRVRSSKCRGAGPAACRGRTGCKYASGKKRSYCRKTRNTRRRRRSRRHHHRGGGSLMAQFKRALVPYALYHSQKTHQRRRRHSRRHRRRSRRSRRGGRRRRRGGRRRRR